jgi:hypothetical protein
MAKTGDRSMWGGRSSSARGWVSKGRRQWADRIADELAQSVGPGLIDPGLIDLVRVRADLGQTAVLRAFRNAWRLAASAEPVPGAIWAITAADRGPIVHATADGWNLLARSDGGPVLLLLDGVPGQVLDLAGADRLGELVSALVAAAPFGSALERF